MKLFKKSKRKHYNLRSELAKWVGKNIGAEYVAEALEKCDKINSGVSIGYDNVIIHGANRCGFEKKGAKENE